MILDVVEGEPQGAGTEGGFGRPGIGTLAGLQNRYQGGGDFEFKVLQYRSGQHDTFLDRHHLLKPREGVAECFQAMNVYIDESETARQVLQRIWKT